MVDTAHLKINDNVRHQRFGPGVVVSVTENAIVVKFRDGKRRRFESGVIANMDRIGE